MKAEVTFFLINIITQELILQQCLLLRGVGGGEGDKAGVPALHHM